MKKLYVSIEMEGRLREVGEIRGDNELNAEFCYSEDYIDEVDARPISISMPLRSEPYGPEPTRNFFEGLLPEGFLRTTVARNNRADSGDYLTLLEMLGAECLGAISIRGENYKPTESCYKELDVETMYALASEGATKSADLVVESHLSLTGASGKVGVYRDVSGKWYLPIGSAPSTHILKQSHIRYDHIVQNEMLALSTASRLGLDVPGTVIVDASPMRENLEKTVVSGSDGEILLATERYDRDMSKSVTSLSGLTCPLRLHQEDFGQALGISSANKYEQAGGSHMKQMFELLRRYSASPIEDQLKLWDIIVYHYLIGNTDGHIKNFSLIYDSKLRYVRLAPAYDIVSTIVYDTHSSQMAFSIGGEMDWNELNRKCFERATSECDLPQRLFMQRFDVISSSFADALIESAKEISAVGYTEASDIAAEILVRKASAV